MSDTTAYDVVVGFHQYACAAPPTMEELEAQIAAQLPDGSVNIPLATGGTQTLTASQITRCKPRTDGGGGSGTTVTPPK